MFTGATPIGPSTFTGYAWKAAAVLTTFPLITSLICGIAAKSFGATATGPGIAAIAASAYFGYIALGGLYVTGIVLLVHIFVKKYLG